MTVGINAHLLSFSADYRTTGIGLYVQKVLQSIHNKSYPLTLFGSDPKIKKVYPNFNFIQSSFNTKNPWIRILWEQLLCDHQIKKHNIDILHSPMHALPLIGAKRYKTVVSIHDLAFALYPQFYTGGKQKYLAYITKQSAKKADKIIALSENTKKDIMRLYNIREQKIEVVYAGLSIKPSKLTPQQEKKIAARLNLPEKYLLFVGTMEPRKNIQGLLDALIQLAKEKKERYTLVIAGPKGWKYDSIEERIKTYETLGQIIKTGYLSEEELHFVYNKASIFLFPSFYEGFGSPVLEAMALGAPVISSHVASIPEVGGNAICYIDPYNTNDLAEKISWIFNNPEEQEKMKKTGIKQAESFTWEKTASQIISVYESL